MRENTGTIYNWLVHSKLKKVIKAHGLTQYTFEALCLIKVVESRCSRSGYLKDIQELVTNSYMKHGLIVEDLERLGLISIGRKSAGRFGGGRPRLELTVTSSGNELLYKIRQASESLIACLKNQLDNDKSRLNKPVKKKKV
jgi:DNA-binding PadR family transcriptional regulator